MRSCVMMLVAAALALAARAETVTLVNPTRNVYQNEPVCLAEVDRKPVRVQHDGGEVPSQVVGGELWIAADLDAGGTAKYSIEEGNPGRFKPGATVKKQGDHLVLENEHLAVRVPTGAGEAIPAPVQALRLNGQWIGSGEWRCALPLKSMTAVVAGEGPLVARVRLRYEFAGKAGLYRDVPAFSEVEVSLFAGQRHAVIRECHEMGSDDRWVFEAAAGWGARSAICIPHGQGNGDGEYQPWPPESLEPGSTRMGDTLLKLLPRWSQAFDDGWFFACHDGRNAVGALACHAGQWHWPHENMIAVQVRPGGKYAGLECPTWKGRRTWMLVAGPVEMWRDGGAKDYVKGHAFESLDRIHRAFIHPPVDTIQAGMFRGRDFFSSAMNPSSAMRGFSRGAFRRIGKPGDEKTLYEIQNLLENDAYGSYWNFWSPENPNFFTDYIRGPIALMSNLEKQPQLPKLARLAEEKLRTDLYHSVSLPGGAGQECPGYLAYAMQHWMETAPVCRDYLGFDPAEWERFPAGASFLLRTAQPVGGGRRKIHPGGDTHPPGTDIIVLAAEFGVKEDPRKYRTEELPGFGAVFRNRPGTDRETYLAFKSGPSRGHYHGDQLSFHYCANARPLAIDHMCSYAPRAGQEHMHNRVAFHTGKLPWANMDGYERLIAFKTGKDVDVAVGQVESERLRVTTEFPPEEWDTCLPEQRLEKDLRYRRTIVGMKNRGEDYFVIRDQYDGPPVGASYCLHVLSDKLEQEGGRFRFDDLTVYCAHPGSFETGRHDWSFEKKNKKTGETYREDTKGLRLSISGEQGEFITVLYPSGKTPAMERIDGGVRVGDDEIRFSGGLSEEGDTRYVTVLRDGKESLVLTGADLDLERSQGEIGLFVPDAGYPFGTIPDWLIRQRARVPDWAPEWVREHRRYDRPSGRKGEAGEDGEPGVSGAESLLEPLWNHEVKFDRDPDRKGRPREPGTAYVWIPPNTVRLRGLLLAQMTRLEERLTKDPSIRGAAARNGLAVVFLNPGFDALFNHVEKQAGEKLQAILADAARVSGRPELAFAPMLTMGHSTAGIFARNIAYWRPERVIGVVHIKSGNLHQHIYGENRSLKGVPFLAINGELEEYGPEGGIRPEYGNETQWIMMGQQLQERRRKDAGNLMSLIVHPGGNHVSWNRRLSELMALFIDKAVTVRVPEEAGKGGAPVRCRPVPPGSGWLTDARIKQPRHEPAAPVAYGGDEAEAYWHLDREIAVAIFDYHRRGFQKPAKGIQSVIEIENLKRQDAPVESFDGAGGGKVVVLESADSRVSGALKLPPGSHEFRLVAWAEDDSHDAVYLQVGSDPEIRSYPSRKRALVFCDEAVHVDLEREEEVPILLRSADTGVKVDRLVVTSQAAESNR